MQLVRDIGHRFAVVGMSLNVTQGHWRPWFDGIHRSVVTMALSCTVSKTRTDLLNQTPTFWVIRQNFVIAFSFEKTLSAAVERISMTGLTVLT